MDASPRKEKDRTGKSHKSINISNICGEAVIEDIGTNNSVLVGDPHEVPLAQFELQNLSSSHFTAG